MAERNDLPKSIFNLGQLRHNVGSKSDVQSLAATFKNYSVNPVRLLEWSENIQKQRFEKPITAKIGSG